LFHESRDFHFACDPLKQFPVRIHELQISDQS